MTEETDQEREVILLSDRDMALVLDLLKNPPPANEKLRAAIAALPKDLWKDSD